MAVPEADPHSFIRVPFSPRPIGGVRAPMIGRDDALQQILARFYGLESRSDTQLISVIAEAGIGKSRLAYEVLRTAAQTTTQVISVHADAAGARPYDLIRRLVIAQFDIDETRDADGGIGRLTQASTRLLGDEGAHAATLIGNLLGIGPAQTEPPAERDGRAARYEALNLMLKGLRALATRGSVLMLLDDLHEADEASLEVIELMLRAGRGMPLLIVGFAQPQLDLRVPRWQLLEADRIVLAPLSDHLARRMVAELLRKAGRLPSELRNAIVGNAEGNPRYIEELIAALIADGVITPGDESWQIHVARLARLRLPGTMGELLRRRVQALSADIRDVLMAAALVGRSFWPGALQVQSAQRPPDLLAQHLDVLLGSGLIGMVESQIIGEREYRFTHSLGYEAALALMPPEARPARHAAIADWLSTQGEEHAALIAAQYAQAGNRQAAATWFLWAGRQAQSRYAIDAAISAYRQALRELAADPTTQVEQMTAYEALGSLLREQARLAEAVEAYRRMHDLALATGDAHAAARAWYGLSRTQDDQIETRASQASARNARDLALSLGDPALLARVLIQLAMTEGRLGDIAQARVLCEQALDAIRGLSESSVHAAALAQLGIMYEQEEQFGEARRTLGEAIRIFRELKYQSDLAYHLSNMGYVCNSAADYAAAVTVLNESLATAEAVDSRIGQIFALSNLGVALNGLGRHAEAETAAQQGIMLCEQVRMAVFPDFYREFALAALGQGRVTEAVEAAQQSLELARHEEDPREIASAWRVLGRAFAAMDEHHGARPCFSESARLLQEIGRRSDRARTLQAWAAYETAYGDATRAAELTAEAQALFAEVGLPTD